MKVGLSTFIRNKVLVFQRNVSLSGRQPYLHQWYSKAHSSGMDMSRFSFVWINLIIRHILKVLSRIIIDNREDRYMGIKPSYIKTVGVELLSRYGPRFSNSFDENKQIVTEVTTIESKRVRNRVAGYVTRKINTGRHS